MIILHLIKSNLGFFLSLILTPLGIYLVLGLLATLMWSSFPKGNTLMWMIVALFMAGLAGGFVVSQFWLLLPYVFAILITAWVILMVINLIIQKFILL